MFLQSTEHIGGTQIPAIVGNSVNDINHSNILRRELTIVDSDFIDCIVNCKSILSSLPIPTPRHLALAFVAGVIARAVRTTIPGLAEASVFSIADARTPL